MKHMHLPLTAFITAAMLSVFGCGGSDDSGAGGASSSCDQVSACGGDIAGSWTIVDFCPDTSSVPDAIMQICESAKLEYDDPSVSGDVEYKADKSYTQNASATGTGYLVLDQACLKQDSVTLTCKQVQDAINEKAKSKVTCSMAGTGCRCGLNINQTTNDTGTYAVSGQNLSLTDKSGSKVDNAFCVKGDKAYITVKLSPEDNESYSFKGQLQLQKK